MNGNLRKLNFLRKARGITPEWKMVMSVIELGLPFEFRDLVHKFQIIC
jgi:hypothetical protein